MKKALITGITGQDGFYLANLLLDKGYEVFGMYRKSVIDVRDRVPDLDKRVKLVEGDLTDSISTISIVKKCAPDEIYNLAALSFLLTSWEEPSLVADVNGMGVLRLLEAIRIVNPKIRLYQASSREIFGIPEKSPQNEETPINPLNPYAAAKAFGQAMMKSYNEKHNIFSCAGIQFNHESPRRGMEFVTRVISDSVAKIKLGKREFMEIGNLDAKRDWGFAGDFMEAAWLTLQQEKPGNYILATGETHTVREFIEEAFNVAGMAIKWEGKGLGEVGKCNNKVVVKINPEYYRPGEAEWLFGDISKARKVLGWRPKTKFKELVRIMVEEDLKRVEEDMLSAGH
jgi:GDPmannose 4,6-dehydratase